MQLHNYQILFSENNNRHLINQVPVIVKELVILIISTGTNPASRDNPHQLGHN